MIKKIVQALKNIIKPVLVRGRLSQCLSETEACESMPTLLFRHPGHFYSPLPDLKYLKENENYIFQDHNELRDIDISVENQLQHLINFKKYYSDLPFPVDNDSKHRYYYNNIPFSYADAIILYSMLRHYNPASVIEIGSGFSSAVMLDTDQCFLKSSINFTFIEPYNDLLLSLLSRSDRQKHRIIQQPIQMVDNDVFKSLKSNDILFIDSSHVSKVGSDLNHIFFNILPELNSGVIIHFHDIFWPFEYPKQWLIEGRAWNEIYLLRAFLTNNQAYEVLYFNSYIAQKERDKLKSTLPLCMKNTGGSLWIKKK